MWDTWKSQRETLTTLFVMQGLDFTPYMSEASAIEGSAPYTYDLAGVCAHDGKSVNCGHYRAVCRSAPGT